MEIYNGKYTVYCHHNPTNGKNYVGITSRPVEQRWMNGLGYRSQHKFNAAIMKYGWKHFQHLIIASNLTEQEAKNFEILLIDKLNSIQHGYNVSHGGDTGNGVVITMEERYQRSLRMRGENNPRYGVRLPDEMKRRIANSLRGKSCPLTTGKLNPMAKPVICNGVYYGCITDCAKALGYSRDTVQGWYSGDHLPPQEFVDNGFGYVGEPLWTKGRKKRIPHYKTICEGIVYDLPSLCAKHYGIQASTMVKWLNGINPMPEKWVKMGLSYVDDMGV